MRFFCFDNPHPPLSLFLIILSSLLSLLSFPASPPFSYLGVTPLPLFSLSLIIWSSSQQSLLQNPSLHPQTSHSPSVYSLIQPWLTPPPAQTATPPETHSRNVIDRTGRTSPFHRPALPIPPFHINLLTVTPSGSSSRSKGLWWNLQISWFCLPRLTGHILLSTFLESFPLATYHYWLWHMVNFQLPRQTEELHLPAAKPSLRPLILFSWAAQ